MKKVRSKRHNQVRKILAGLVALTAFATVSAFATGFDVLGATIGGGTEAATTCVPANPGGVRTDYVIDDDTQMVTAINVHIIAVNGTSASTACDGQVVHVALLDGSNAALASGNDTVATGGLATPITGVTVDPADIASVKSTVTER